MLINRSSQGAHPSTYIIQYFRTMLTPLWGRNGIHLLSLNFFVKPLPPVGLQRDNCTSHIMCTSLHRNTGICTVYRSMEYLIPGGVHCSLFRCLHFMYVTGTPGISPVLDIVHVHSLHTHTHCLLILYVFHMRFAYTCSMPCPLSWSRSWAVWLMASMDCWQVRVWLWLRLQFFVRVA